MTWSRHYALHLKQPGLAQGVVTNQRRWRKEHKVEDVAALAAGETFRGRLLGAVDLPRVWKVTTREVPPGCDIAYESRIEAI